MIAAMALSKVLGMLRSVLLASHYGTGTEANAFTAATQIPLTCFDLLLSAAILGCFIPVYNSFFKDGGSGEAKADRFACVFLNFVITVTGILTVAGILFADPLLSLISPDLTQAEHSLGVVLLRIMFPMILFTGAAYTLVGVLQSKNEFIVPSLISCISNLGVILYFVLLDRALGENGIYGVAVAYSISWVLQLVTLIVPLRKKGFRYHADFHFGSPQMKKVLIMCLPVMIGSWQAPLGVLLGTYFAPRLAVDGALTIFGYTNNLYVIITGILTYGICNYIFPRLSRQNALGDEASFCKTCQSGILSALAIVLPIMAGVLILSGEGVSIIYRRGEFGAQAARETAYALRLMCIGMPCNCMIELCNRMMYSKTKTKVPMIAALVGALSNLLCCLAFIRIPQLRVGSLTLASALGQLVACIILIAALYKSCAGIFEKTFLFSFLKLLAAAACSFFVMWLCHRFFGKAPYTDGFLRNVLCCCVVFFPGLLAYGGMLKLLRFRLKFSKKEEVLREDN